MYSLKKGNLLSGTRDGAERGNKSYNDSIMPQLLSEEETDAMDSDNEYDDEPMSTDMLEYICDGSQPHPSINRIEAR